MAINGLVKTAVGLALLMVTSGCAATASLRNQPAVTQATPIPWIAPYDKRDG